MKLIFLIIIVLCVVTEAFGLASIYEINSSNIDNFPIFVLVDVDKEKGNYRLHLRDTGNLQGLGGEYGSVYIKVMGENKIETFDGKLSLYYDKKIGTYSTDFSISANNISGSSLRIISSHSSTADKIIDTRIFIYNIKLQLIHDKFSRNKFSAGAHSRLDESPAFYNFLDKKFINERQKTSQPLNSADPKSRADD